MALLVNGKARFTRCISIGIPRCGAVVLQDFFF